MPNNNPLIKINIMNKLFVGALAFATGVIVENKYNVVKCLIKACGKDESKDDPKDVLEEEFEPAPSE